MSELRQVRLRGGPPVHPHIYSKRVFGPDKGVSDGDMVRIATREGRPCGYGFWHSRSMISLRVLSYDPDVVPDEAWLRERVRNAALLRSDLLHLPERTDAWRVIHAEGDGLSGLVVDRYGTTGSVTLFSLGWQKRLEELKTVLREEAGLEDVVVRADQKATTHEGLSVPEPKPRKEIEIREDDLRLTVDPTGGHKTGYFLDQRDNRRRLAGMARGRTVFDGMTYTGGFALAAAKAGAASVRGMDLDETAIERAEKNARLNGVKVDFQHGDVFDALRAYGAAPEENRPEIVVVDPPKWARDRAGLGVALGRYRDLNRLALLAVRPGGLVVTSSCSGLVGMKAFHDVVKDAALDTRRDLRILHEGGAGPDHPVAATVPESRYLKCMFLAVGPAGSGPGGSERERGGPDRKPRSPRGPRRI